MEFAIWLALFLPLIGFLILLFTSESIGRTQTSWIGCLTVFISFLCFAGVVYFYEQESHNPFMTSLYNWIPLKELKADVSLYIDSLSLLMTLIITGVGFLIHVYSAGYMEHEEDYARFFACMNLFIFAMLLLVLASNLLLLFVGWEGVGLASYLLIGYYYHRPTAAQAAVKAFVVNRIGDLGLLIGIILTFYTFGTSDVVDVMKKSENQFAIGAPLLGVLTLLYFIGATGKSAQIPLHVWLPDAMEGPTPVSALIHAATMVTAGVYLVVRMHPLFMLAPNTMHLVGAIGGATSLFAALCAVGQTDLKRVLAYSTVSQLGLMFLACGVGAFYAAMFHLTMHAFMKALLFLSAGDVVHMMRGVTEMDKMGGLAKRFPVTHILFFIGVLAMSGVPPLAAFFSKDLILEQDYLAGFYVFFYVGLAASILTAFYLTRAYYLTFAGQPRLDSKILKSVHEAPRIMLIPVTILAILSIFGGLLGSFFTHPILEVFLGEADVKLAVPSGFVITPETWMSIIGGFLGIGAAYFLYRRYAQQIGVRTFAFLRKAFYVDEIYDAVFVNPLKKLSQWIDNILEPDVFVGSIRGVAEGTQGIATWLQRVQSGQIRSYVAWMAVGTVLLIIYFIA
jgi:NADH-quinone oxidoreductase subunit L